MPKSGILRPPPLAFAPPPRRKIIIETDWEPWGPEQASVLRATELEIDATCGRRFGKTALCAAWITGIWEGATWGAVHTPGGRFWYTAPTLKPACKDFYRKLKNALGELVREKNDTDLSLTLFNGALIECKSLECYDNLRGPGLDGLVVDEKGTVVEDAWTTVLSPMLADPEEHCPRRVLRVGTPRGMKHWTYREHVASLADPGGREGRVAFQFPTSVRPGMARYLARKERTMPRNAFDQEYGAVFLANSAGYFKAIPEAHDGKPPPERPENACRYTAGMDFGHVDDWTVIVIVQASPRPMRVVAMIRFNPVPWPLTKARGIEAFRTWDTDALIDDTPSGAPGEITIAAFKPEWTRVAGFNFRDGGGREELLANLAIMLETGELKLPGTYKKPAFPVLTTELDGFVYEALSSGRFRAKAGPNLNDDCVMALALAAWKAKHGMAGYVSGIAAL